MNKFILVSNIKGGVGKTTVTECLAHYMNSKGMPVVVVDADLQRTLAHDLKADLQVKPYAQKPWEVVELNTLNLERAAQTIKELKRIPAYIIVDCPGNLQDECLVMLFKEADTIIIPLSFDRKTLDGTSTFVSAIRKLKVTAKLAFVPNRIVTTEGNAEYLARRAEAKRIFSHFGNVTARIKQSVIFNRVNTLTPLDKYLYNAVENTCNDLIEVINANKEEYVRNR